MDNKLPLETNKPPETLVDNSAQRNISSFPQYVVIYQKLTIDNQHPVHGIRYCYFGAGRYVS